MTESPAASKAAPMTKLQRYDYQVRIRFERRTGKPFPDDDALTTEIADLNRARVHTNDAVSYFVALLAVREAR